MALAWGKRVIAVGPAENVFCHLPQLEVVGSWPAARNLLLAQAGSRVEVETNREEGN